MFMMFAKEWRTFLHDKKSFITYLLAPFVLIGILGIALSGAFADETSTIDPVPLSISNKDQGELGGMLQDVLEGEAFIDVFTIVQQDAEVNMTIPQDYTKSLMQGELDGEENKPEPLVIETDLKGSIGVSVLEQTVNQFGASVMQPSIKKETQNDQDTVPLEIPVETLSGTTASLSAFQYYAIGMGVMYLLFMGLGGTKAMLLEMERHTLMRLSVAYLPLWRLMLGKFLGWTMLGVCQFLVLMAGTHYVYGVDWGTSYIAMSVLLLTYVWAVTSLGMLLSTLISNEKIADRVGTFLIMILAAAGGSMLPIFFFSPFMNHITSIIPNAWALRGFIEILQGATLSDIRQNVIVLAGMGMVFFVVAAFRLTKTIGGERT